MEDRIYMFTGQLEILIGEKFEQLPSNFLQMYVWRSPYGSLGFDIRTNAFNFIKRFFEAKLTISFPELKSLSPDNEQRNVFISSNAVTFLDHIALINEEHLQYSEYKNNQRKNALLERYGKQTEALFTPEISKWYNEKERKYTKVFIDFMQKKWHWFYHLGFFRLWKLLFHI